MKHTLGLLFLFFTSLSIGQHLEKFRSFDHTMIAYTDEGEGMPIVLVHGFISSGKSWTSTILKNALLANGYRVIVPDLRGNGNSDQPKNKEAYQNNAEVKDLVALADHLKLPSYFAIGYSRGSIVLAKLLTFDSRIKKAVLGGMGLDFTNPEWDRRIAFQQAFSGEKEPDDMTTGAINYALSIGAELEILGLLQEFQPVTSVEELHRVKTDILVIAGDQDHDNGDPKALSAQFKKSNLVIVPGDHNGTYKSKPFSTEIISFLEVP